MFFATIIQKSKVSVLGDPKKDPNCLLIYKFWFKWVDSDKTKESENSKKVLKKLQSDGSNFKSEVMFETKITNSYKPNRKS